MRCAGSGIKIKKTVSTLGIQSATGHWERLPPVDVVVSNNELAGQRPVLPVLFFLEADFAVPVFRNGMLADVGDLLQVKF